LIKIKLGEKMLNELVKIANNLDERGLVREADYLDHIIKLSRDYASEIAAARNELEGLEGKRFPGRRGRRRIEELTEHIESLESAQAAAAAAVQTAEDAEAERAMAGPRPAEEGADPAGVVQPTDTTQRTSPGQAATGQSTGSAGEIQDGSGYEYNVIGKDRLGPAPKEVSFKITKVPSGKSGLGYVITQKNNSAAHSILVEIAAEKFLGGEGDEVVGRVVNEFRSPHDGFKGNVQLQWVWSDIQERLSARPTEADFSALAVNQGFASKEVDGLVAAARFAFGS
jgi:hypothetical protein